ncbi:MAG: phosphocholine cytidylyltransferase family protein [Thermococcus sp.]|nr:phosphocholine cytidylyltransferase family protein [Thermococcus sp.]
MNVIILAAGMGKRLRPLTQEIPKCMVKVNGMPIIEYEILAYKQSGIEEEEINIVIGYKHEIIQEFLKAKYPRINVITNTHYESTNNMYSLYLAIEEINLNNEVIVNNGDCIYEPGIVQKIIASKRKNYIAVDKGNYTEENMKIIVENGLVRGISKSIPKEKSYGTSIDLYKFTDNTIQKLRSIILQKFILSGDRTSWIEEAINELVKEEDVYPLNIKGFKWAEIDDHNDLKQAESIFSPLMFKKSL